jgi:hypothetical protein
MNPIKLTVHSTGTGPCALTGRDCDGLTVAFDGEPPCFLSWKALRQLMSMKVGRQPKAAAGPAGVTAVKS